MGRSKKVKKVRHIEDMYKGDEKHDDAPTREWERDILIEKRKLEAKVRKEQHRRQQKQKQRETEKINNNAQSKFTDARIRPNESLRSFNDRIENQSRVIQAEQAKIERNKRRRERKAERAMEDADDGDGWRESKYDDDDEKRAGQKRSLPRFLDVAERPPELESISHDKKRFVDLAPTASSSKEQQMTAMLQRVQGLYRKKQKS